MLEDEGYKIHQQTTDLHREQFHKDLQVIKTVTGCVTSETSLSLDLKYWKLEFS